MKSLKNLLCCWAGIGLLLGSVGCNLHAFAVFPPNHQQVTLEALGNCCFEYTLPNGAKVTLSTKAVISVMAGNFNIDILSLTDEKFAEDYHFDDERFSLGQYLLLNTRDLIITQMRDEAFGKSDPTSLLRQQMLTKTSREMLGNALHTLQDYYAHSNWVERGLQNGNLSVNPILGARGEILHGPSAQTCEENAAGDVPLTSGYYLASGVLDCTNICNAPVTECAHGNIVCPLLECGINKDISTRDYYAEAFDLATQHTKLFVQKIFDEALIGDSALKNRVSIAICQFMGVPDPVGACLSKYHLQVQKEGGAPGPELGTVVSDPKGINCGSACAADYTEGTKVLLTAIPRSPWRFAGWRADGACGGNKSKQCTVSMDADRTAVAVFSNLPAPGMSLASNTIVNCYIVDSPFGGNADSYCNFIEDGAWVYPISITAGDGEVSGGSVTGRIDRRSDSLAIEVSGSAFANAQGYIKSGGSLGVSKSDWVTVTSDVLPAGTPVTIRVTFGAHQQLTLVHEDNGEDYPNNTHASSPGLVSSSGGPWGNLRVELEPGNNLLQPGSYAQGKTVHATFETTVPAAFSIGTSVGFDWYFQVVENGELAIDFQATADGPWFTEVNGQDVNFTGSNGFNYEQ